MGETNGLGGFTEPGWAGEGMEASLMPSDVWMVSSAPRRSLVGFFPRPTQRLGSALGTPGQLEQVRPWFHLLYRAKGKHGRARLSYGFDCAGWERRFWRLCCPGGREVWSSGGLCLSVLPAHTTPHRLGKVNFPQLCVSALLAC